MRVNYIGIQTLVTREVTKFLKTSIQSLVGPWSSALLYIVIFGTIIGSKVTFLEGRYSYLEFVFPGILTLNVIIGAFRQSTFSLYLARFTKHIDEMLVSPLSNFDLVLGYVLGALLRSFVIGSGIYLIAVFFGIGKILHFWQFLLFSFSIAAIFSNLGLVCALWAESWEQLSVLEIFVITPLSFLGGLFTSLDMISPKWRWLFTVNPFFYFIDGIRYCMIGERESNFIAQWSIIVGLLILTSIWTGLLFHRGYKIKP